MSRRYASHTLISLVTAFLTALAVLFVILPLYAVVARVTWADMSDLVHGSGLWTALRISLISSLVGHVVVLAVGTPVAYALARSTFPGRSIIIGLLELPIVLPPAVAGIGLLAAYGRNGLLGGTLDVLGLQIPFTLTAVIMAVIFTSGALYIRQAIAAFSAIDDQYLEVAQTLGASPIRVFVRVAIPLSLPGLESGSALALARGFGEFGATIMFAGSMPGVTQTLPLEVYALLDVDFQAALAASVVLIALGVGLLVANKGGAVWATSRLT